MSRRAVLIGIGAFTGLASGLLGVGGGPVMVPAMVYLLKTPQREANGRSLAVIVPIALVGVVILGRGHDVNLPVGVALAVDAVVQATHVIGSLASGLQPTGLALTLIALSVGLLSGVLSGLLVIGGGIVMVPAMTLLLGLSQHLAQGTSLLLIIPTALSGSLTHWRMGNISLALAASDEVLRLIFGAYLGFTGARMLKTPNATVAQPTIAIR